MTSGLSPGTSRPAAAADKRHDLDVVAGRRRCSACRAGHYFAVHLHGDMTAVETALVQ